MSTVKNPLRQLASAIVSACHRDGAKGVKQTTVLTVLSHANGFRSIQCGDAAATGTPTSARVSVKQRDFLQMFLYSVYTNSDLFGIDIEDVGPHFNTEQAQTLGAPDFVMMWHWLANTPAHFIMLLDRLIDDIEHLAREAIRYDHPAGRGMGRLNADWVPFLTTELRECSEELSGSNRTRAHYEALNRLSCNYQNIKAAFEANEFAWSLVSKGLLADADAPAQDLRWYTYRPESEATLEECTL